MRDALEAVLKKIRLRTVYQALWKECWSRK
jgi:hypothetical protein